MRPREKEEGAIVYVAKGWNQLPWEQRCEGIGCAQSREKRLQAQRTAGTNVWRLKSV